MSNDGRYYWIKLNTDFLRPDGPMDILMSQENGSQYVMLYLMLCLNTANTNGQMCAQYGEMIVPYDEQKIVRDCRYFSIDTVRVALTMYQQLGLIFVNHQNILQIANYNEMVGSESKWAKYKRKGKQEAIEEKEPEVPMIGKSIGTELENFQQEIRDKRLDTRDKDNREEVGSEPPAAQPASPTVITLPLNDNSEYPISAAAVAEWKELYPAVDVMQQLRNMKGWLKANPTKKKTKRGINAFIVRWLSGEQDNAGRKDNRKQYQPAQQKPNQFNNYHQRKYDYEKLEKVLLGRQPEGMRLEDCEIRDDE